MAVLDGRDGSKVLSCFLIPPTDHILNADVQLNRHLDVICETIKDISEQLAQGPFAFVAHFNDFGNLVFSNKCY